MKNIKNILISSLLIVVLLIIRPIHAQIKEAPANVAAALIVKLVSFAKNICDNTGDITIYVLGSAEIAEELKKGIGKNIGNAILKNVDSGADLPATAPSVLYIGDTSRLKEVIRYSRSNKILSTTGDPDLVKEGITLGVGVGDDAKPKILLNLTSSVEEGLDWNPAIMKIVQTVK